MRDMVKPALILCVICLVVGLLLSFANSLTADIIAKRAEEDINVARKEVLRLSSNVDFNFVKADNWKDSVNDSGNYKNVKDVYKVMMGETFQAYIITTTANGFGGPMDIMAGISASGRVNGVKVLDNKETPGLGSKVTDSNFLSQYKNLPVNTVLKVVKNKNQKGNIGEIQAVTGATVSSKAVSSAVQTAINLVAELEKVK